jgi:glycosyltransferase involved in cell wall biosynthesis
LFSRASAGVRRLVRELLPAPLRRSYHRFALLRDFGIEPRTGRRRPPVLDGALPRGLNVVGWFDSSTGIGQSVRSLARSAEAAGLPVERIEASALGSGARVSAPYALNLFHVNADGAGSIVELCGPAVHRGRANVGYWYWETEVFPAIWSDRFSYFDEIWVASEFCRAAIAASSEIPVAVVPPPVILDDLPVRTAPSAGVPFRFLTICDAESVAERKNPLGAVRAFARAFPEDSAVALTVKIANAGTAPALVESLANAAGSAHVEIDTSALARGDIERLLAGCDVYVSLHRAEGFGLPIAEAMALGKPVVATGYSGPLDFLDETTGYPVRWTPAVLDRARGPYPAGTRWAEPDEAHAAETLRRVVSDRSDSARRGQAAKRRMESLYGLEAAGRRLAEHADRLRARLAAQP